MYNPPITLIIDQIHHKLMADMDNRIVQAVGKIGISIDKDELIKALAYDRNQYEQGYADAELAALNRIVRCKDCKHRPLRGENKWANVFGPEVPASDYAQHATVEDETCPWLCDDEFYSEMPPDDFFCAYGERY